MIHARPAFETIFFSANMPREKVRSYFVRMGNESFSAFLDIVLLDRPNPELVKTRPFPVAHDMMLEANWEQVAGRIVTWLQEQNL